MKVKLKAGDHEIKVEGSKGEVDQLLEHWWNRLTPHESGKGSAPEHKAPKPAAKHKSAQSSKSNDDDEANFDPIPITHAIKENGRNALYQAHILHKKNIFHKIALVCIHADRSLTSGEIAKTLRALDIKADQGNISTALKKNSGKFLSTAARKQGGGAPPKYKLTSQARAEFEAWLSDQEK